MCRRHLAWPVFPTHGGRTGERSQHSEMNSLLRRCQARAYTTHLKRRDKGREGHVSQLRKYETEHGPVASGLARVGARSGPKISDFIVSGRTQSQVSGPLRSPTRASPLATNLGKTSDRS